MNMADEIKTTKELKRRKFNVCLDCGQINCQNADHCSRPAIWVSDVNSFEAGVQKRIGELEKETKVGIYGMILAANPGEVRELRRFLEGEGGEKE